MCEHASSDDKDDILPKLLAKLVRPNLGEGAEVNAPGDRRHRAPARGPHTLG